MSNGYALLLIYTIGCIILCIFAFIYYAFTISSKFDRKEEEKDEENNFITNNDIDNEFWNDK